MLRQLLPALILMVTVLSATPSFGTEWARKMFSATSHDFGAVAKGAKSVYRFELQNIYKEDVHIASVRTSCGCTTPTIEKQDLKTWEKSAIVATFNTRTFSGDRKATLTVTIDRPFYAEVQLEVKGYIRSDVVFYPGEVNFGEVEQNQGGEQVVSVSYAGRPDWRITDVRSANKNFEVALKRLPNRGNRTDFQMVIRLKPGGDVGYIQDQLTIVTNDARRKTLTLPVSGRVLASLEVSPASLFLGVLAPGESVTKNLLIKGAKPFRITEILCDNEAFDIAVPPGDQAKPVHLVPVKFTAGTNAGELVQQIKVRTDLGSLASCVATATIELTGAE